MKANVFVFLISPTSIIYYVLSAKVSTIGSNVFVLLKKCARAWPLYFKCVIKQGDLTALNTSYFCLQITINKKFEIYKLDYLYQVSNLYFDNL